MSNQLQQSRSMLSITLADSMTERAIQEAQKSTTHKQYFQNRTEAELRSILGDVTSALKDHQEKHPKQTLQSFAALLQHHIDLLQKQQSLKSEIRNEPFLTKNSSGASWFHYLGIGLKENEEISVANDSMYLNSKEENTSLFFRKSDQKSISGRKSNSKALQ